MPFKNMFNLRDDMSYYTVENFKHKYPKTWKPSPKYKHTWGEGIYEEVLKESSIRKTSRWVE